MHRYFVFFIDYLTVCVGTSVVLDDRVCVDLVYGPFVLKLGAARPRMQKAVNHLLR